MHFDPKALWEAVKLIPGVYSAVRAFRERGRSSGRVMITVDPVREGVLLTDIAASMDETAALKKRLHDLRRLMLLIRSKEGDDAAVKRNLLAMYAISRVEAERQSKPEVAVMFEKTAALIATYTGPMSDIQISQTMELGVASMDSLLVRLEQLDDRIAKAQAEQTAIVKFIGRHVGRD